MMLLEAKLSYYRQVSGLPLLVLRLLLQYMVSDIAKVRSGQVYYSAEA
jgi:hypothetical protein